MVLNANSKTFVMYVAIQKQEEIAINSIKKAYAKPKAKLRLQSQYSTKPSLKFRQNILITATFS